MVLPRIALVGQETRQKLVGKPAKKMKLVNSCRRRFDCGFSCREWVGGFLDGNGFSSSVLSLLREGFTSGRIRFPPWPASVEALLHAGTSSSFGSGRLLSLLRCSRKSDGLRGSLYGIKVKRSPIRGLSLVGYIYI